MILKEDLTTDEILAKLDQTSRKTRIISIALSSLLLLILGLISVVTFLQLRNYLNLQSGGDGGRETIDALRKENKELANALQQIKESLSANEIEKAKNISANTNISSSLNPIPTASPIINKTPNNANTTANTQIPVNNSPSTVYVQITKEQQRSAAKQLIQNLGGNFNFPGIELVDRQINKTEVRYFRRDDKEQADDLANQLNNSNILTTSVFTDLKAPDSLLKIWFSNDAFPQ